MRVAVTGAGGRLGTARSSAALAGARSSAAEVLAWDLPEHDLDDPLSAGRLVSAFRPDVVVHTAAWTDVDGCATDPDLAMRRNGTAAGEMAEACARARAGAHRGVDKRGLRRPADGRPAVRPDRRPEPTEPLRRGQAGRRAGGSSSFRRDGRRVRGGSWLRPGHGPRRAGARRPWQSFGRPGSSACPAPTSRRRSWPRLSGPGGGQTLSLVADEVGCPTYASDLAGAIVALLAESEPARRPRAWRHPPHRQLRAERPAPSWAREVLTPRRRRGRHRRRCRSPGGRDLRTPPRWGVLEPTPLRNGPLRPWQDASAEYMTLIVANPNPGR